MQAAVWLAEGAYLGGMEIIMCTWSGIRCPSSIRLSFCSASFPKTSRRCRRNSLYRVFLRHLGINTTWSCALAAHAWEFLRWTPAFVKLLLPPRQSRGVSLLGLGEWLDC
jgi:hypothetical protein